MTAPRRKIRIRKYLGRWEWECTLCHPAVIGGTMSWAKTVANAARHCERNKRYHHVYVLDHHGAYLPE